MYLQVTKVSFFGPSVEKSYMHLPVSWKVEVESDDDLKLGRTVRLKFLEGGAEYGTNTHFVRVNSGRDNLAFDLNIGSSTLKLYTEAEAPRQSSQSQ